MKKQIRLGKVMRYIFVCIAYIGAYITIGIVLNSFKFSKQIIIGAIVNGICNSILVLYLLENFMGDEKF